MMENLTTRQARFVEHYINCGSASEAARRAGYSERSARVIGPETLSKPAVMDAVRARQSAVAEQLEISRDQVIAGIREAIELAKAQGETATVISGWRELGRICGYYDKDRETKVSINITAKRMIDQLETMSDAELLKLVADEG